MMNSLTRVINILVQVGGWSILSAACLVTYDVITRKLFSISIAGADEISGYVFAISTGCAYSYALITRANIRIDFIYNRMPESVQRILDIVSMGLMVGFFGVICYFSYTLVADALLYESRSITPLQTPLAYPQSLWFAALCFAVFTSFTLLIISIVALLKGDKDHVKQLIGIPSLDEEIQAELGHETTVSDVKKHRDGKA